MMTTMSNNVEITHRWTLSSTCITSEGLSSPTTDGFSTPTNRGFPELQKTDGSQQHRQRSPLNIPKYYTHHTHSGGFTGTKLRPWNGLKKLNLQLSFETQSSDLPYWSYFGSKDNLLWAKNSQVSVKMVIIALLGHLCGPKMALFATIWPFFDHIFESSQPQLFIKLNLQRKTVLMKIACITPWHMGTYNGHIHEKVVIFQQFYHLELIVF